MEFFSQTTEIYVWAFALLILVFVQQMCRCATLKEKAEQWEARAKEWQESSDNWEGDCKEVQDQLDKYMLPPPDWIEVHETKEEETAP